MNIDVKSEDYHQMMFVQWMRRTYPEHRIFAIPNGGLRNVVVAMRMKATGTVAGIPDLFIPSMKMFIEMKREKGGKVSDEQADWLNYLTTNGYICYVANGFLDAQQFILMEMK